MGHLWEGKTRKGKKVQQNSALLLAALFTVGHAILFIAYLVEFFKHIR